eukprot:TRINITY_DN32452_c0_g1_i1.p1 TRINITY_DN32452_c0_g1~~TRINITY_DN32452_c0_g1_i1.p1  ORF type:complete len:1319 (+),score=175.42 TRINITY_DN32452_c0_g1_i1:107-4063(+)
MTGKSRSGGAFHPVSEPQPIVAAVQACLTGTLAELRESVLRGADLLRWRNSLRQDLLFSAVQRATELPDTLEICRFLVDEAGLQPDVPDAQLAQTALFFASAGGHAGVVKFLLERHASVDRADSNQQTPLYYAARNGRPSCVEALVAGRADVGWSDCNGQSPIFYAVKHAHLPCLETLLTGAGGQVSLVSNARDRWGRTALFNANDAKCCTALLSRGCNPNVITTSGQSALFEAAQSGNDIKIEILLKWRADVDHCDKNRQTPLFIACDAGHLDTCKLLVERGLASLTCRDKENRTPCRIAQMRGHTQVVNYLQERIKFPTPAVPSKPGVCRNSKRRKTELIASAPNDFTHLHSEPSVTLEKTFTPMATPVDEQTGFCLPSTGIFEQSPDEELPRAVLEGSFNDIVRLVKSGKSPKILNRAGLNLAFQVALRAPQRGSCRDIACLLIHEYGLSPTYVDLHARTPLFHAVSHGHTETATTFVEARCDVSRQDCHGQTPLFLAARLKDPACSRMLLDRKADPNVVSSNGRTPLAEAAAAGSNSVIQLLLERGAKKDTQTCMFAAVASSVATLVNAGLHPDTRNQHGITPVIDAAERGDAEKVDALLTHRADVRIRDSSGATVLHYAVRAESFDVCQLLIRSHGADVTAKDDNGMTPADVAGRQQWDKGRTLLQEESVASKTRAKHLTNVVKNGPVEQLHDILARNPTAASAVDSQGRPLLFHAASRRQEIGDALQACKDLVEVFGQDPSAVCQHTGQTALFEASRTGNAEVCKYLMGRGCRVDAVDVNGRSALFSAAFVGSAVTVSTLLEGRADVNCVDENSQTPLCFAAGKDAECVQLLLRARASPNVADDNGQTPLFFAAKHGIDAAVSYLISARADADATDRPGRTALYYAVAGSQATTAAQLLDEGGEVCGERTAELTLMAHRRGLDEVEVMLRARQDADEGRARQRREAAAVLAQSISKVTSQKELDECIAAGLNIHATDSDGRGALHLTACRRDPAAALLCETLVATIGIKPSTTDLQGRTPLFEAAQQGSEACARCLLALSAEVDVQDRLGQTPLVVAAALRQVGVVQILIRRRANLGLTCKDGRTALHAASGADVVRILLDAGASLTARSEGSGRGKTALHCAASRGDVEACGALVAAGSSVNAADQDGRTPLFAAALFGASLTMVRFLVQEAWADPTVQDNQGATITKAALAFATDSASDTSEAPNIIAPSEGGRPRQDVLEYLDVAANLAKFQAGKKHVRSDRRRYCFVFRDPEDPSRTIPFETPEYEAALSALCRVCPWLPSQHWQGRPLTKGITDHRQGMAPTNGLVA